MKNSGCFQGNKEFIKYRDQWYKENYIKIIHPNCHSKHQRSCTCKNCGNINIIGNVTLDEAIRTSWKKNQNYEYNCHKCSSIKKRGLKNYSWNGGKYKNKNGYIVVSIENIPKDKFNKLFHNFNYKKRRVYEHRYIMAKHLNKPLLDTEIVHHINGIKAIIELKI